MGRAFLGTHQQQHLGVGVDRRGKTLGSPIGHRLAEGLGGPMHAVSGTFRTLEAGHHGRDRRGRGLEVGGAQGEVEQLWTSL